MSNGSWRFTIISTRNVPKNARVAMLNRREFLAVTGVSAVGAALASVPRFSSVAALPPAKPDLALRIAPVSVEIAPGVVINTVGYNGKVPGPILRFREGKRITVDVHNTPAR